MSQLLPVSSFFYNFDTKLIQDAQGNPLSDYTFEAPEWDAPYRPTYNAVRYLNPRMYATTETAQRILSWCKKVAPMVNFRIVEERIYGSWVQYPQYSIEAGANDVTEKYNAGLLASNLTFSPSWAEQGFRAELKYAGLMA